MNKKEYVMPAIMCMPVKIESLLTNGTVTDDDELARQFDDLDFEEFEEEAGESSSNWNK